MMESVRAAPAAGGTTSATGTATSGAVGTSVRTPDFDPQYDSVGGAQRSLAVLSHAAAVGMSGQRGVAPAGPDATHSQSALSAAFEAQSSDDEF